LNAIATRATSIYQVGFIVNSTLVDSERITVAAAAISSTVSPFMRKAISKAQFAQASVRHPSLVASPPAFGHASNLDD
jgi:hypothetical protein